MSPSTLYYLYLIPLVASISLVYSASRHERWARIWRQSIRLGLAIFGILAIATVILLLISPQV